MTFKRPKARVLERTITAGNGPYATTSIDTSYNRFSSFMSVGDTTFATVVEPGVAFWTGIVTYSAANQITLTTVEETAGTFGAGTKEIFAGMLAARGAVPDDISGAIVTGGTSTAYTVTSIRVYDSLTRLNGNMIAFTPHTTSGAAPTLNVDGLGAKPLRAVPSTDFLPGVLIQGTPYLCLYNHSDQVFYLHGMFGNPYGVPLSAGFDYWGPTTPNSAFAFPIGQGLNTTTYAALFAIIGYTYGGSGATFNLPDKTGRVSAMKEATATRLTNSGTGNVGIDGGTLGAAGGGSQTLLTANLPAYTPAGGITNGAITVTNADPSLNQVRAGSTGLATGSGASVSAQTYTVSQAASSFAGTAQGGTSTPVKVAQPTIVCNYIIRVL